MAGNRTLADRASISGSLEGIVAKTLAFIPQPNAYFILTLPDSLTRMSARWTSLGPVSSAPSQNTHRDTRSCWGRVQGAAV